VPRLSDDAAALLKAHAFPGNVRELENVLERAMTLCESSEIRAADLGLSDSVRDEPPREEAEAAPSDSDDLDAVLQNVERKTILNALEQSRWNKTAAAKILGISFGALRYRMQKFRID
jgi:two-component system response regulator PilR (NtrC family)